MREHPSLQDLEYKGVTKQLIDASMTHEEIIFEQMMDLVEGGICTVNDEVLRERGFIL